MIRLGLGSVLLAFAVAVIALPSQAQHLNFVSSIRDTALTDVTGATRINQSAGEQNFQVNATVFAVNNTGPAFSFIAVFQHNDPLPEEDPLPPDLQIISLSSITGSAFSGAKGLLSVNQASGYRNMQANLVSVTLGLDGQMLAEAELSQTTSGELPPPEFEADSFALTGVSPNAFAEAAGVIQLNQVAGIANRTFNRVSLTFSGGANP